MGERLLGPYVSSQLFSQGSLEELAFELDLKDLIKSGCMNTKWGENRTCLLCVFTY